MKIYDFVRQRRSRFRDILQIINICVFGAPEALTEIENMCIWDVRGAEKLENIQKAINLCIFCTRGVENVENMFGTSKRRRR